MPSNPRPQTKAQLQERIDELLRQGNVMFERLEALKTQLKESYLTHHTRAVNSFRPGKSALIRGIGYHPKTRHLCYEVQYSDGFIDHVVAAEREHFAITPNPISW